MIACMGECGICLITGFFCIFICHPFIQTEIAKSRMSYICTNINSAFFNGNLVFSSSADGSVVVNTDYIANATYMSPAMTSATVAPIAVAAAPRQMAVQIPPGAPPGSTLTVQTPEGAQAIIR
jgi:hypothetical protein